MKKKYVGSHEKAREETISQTQKKPAKQKRIKKRWIAVAALVLVPVMLLGGVYGVISHYTGKLNYIKRGTEKDMVAITPPPVEGASAEKLKELEETLKTNLEAKADWDFTSKDVTNILLIGADNTSVASLNERGNADGLIIVSINNETKQLILTSLMRDIYAFVPDKSYFTKLTLAYHYAGTEALINTIETNFGIPIDNYVLVNYLTIVDIVDAVGGLSLDVNASELFFMTEKIQQLNIMLGKPGMESVIDPEDEGTLTLNGVQTAAYMRIRYAGDGDLDRTARAREVILALKDKALTMNLSQLNSLAQVALPNITTDLDQGEILSLMLSAPKMLKYEMVSSRIPIDDSFHYEDINGSMVVIDYGVNSEYLYKSIYEGKTK